MAAHDPYYDLRYDHYVNFYTPSTPSGTYTSVLTTEGELAAPIFNPNEIFTPYIDDFGLTVRRHTMTCGSWNWESSDGDLRAVGFRFSVCLGCCVPPGLRPTIADEHRAIQIYLPNLPLFATVRSLSLEITSRVVPSPMFCPARHRVGVQLYAQRDPLFHATWTDNRDVVPPADGNWGNYKPPPIIAGTTGDADEPSSSRAKPCHPCRVGQEGMRNQNIYTAQITGGLVVGAPGNAKPLGTTTFTNPVTE